MRELLLFRHAKARRDQPEDQDRDLTPRGRRAARRMGRLLLEESILPSLVLCSPARRATRTLELASEPWPAQPPTLYLKTLYLAPAGRLLQVIHSQPAGAERLMLVGHNPGLQRLALDLLAGCEEPAPPRGSIAETFPTAALARIAFDAATWIGALPRAGRLLAFWCPRDLED